MPEPDGRALTEAFIRAVSSNDLDALESILAPDIVSHYPQSGERFVGRRNFRALLERFPNRDAGFQPGIEQVIADEPGWVVSPGFIAIKVSGSGRHFTTTGRVRYPDGSEWHVVQLIEIHDGRISRVTSYFGEPFEAPDWRAPFREAPTR